MSAGPVPLSVIGGYLGAGKTTLVNRILSGTHGRRVAVIVNDFGDLAIDEALLGPAVGGVRALANGCVCCAAVDGLGTALEEVAALDPPMDHVIIEVSGVGDPWAVAQWGRTPRYSLEGVVVVADPTEIRHWLEDAYVGDTVRRQLEVADLVVLSRDDVVGGDEMAVARGVVEAVSDAMVVAGSDMALTVLIGVESRGVGAATGHRAHAARDFVPARRPRAEIQSWLEAAPEAVVRVKGFVPGDDEMLVAQRAGRRVEVRSAAPEAVAGMTVIVVGDVVPREVDAWIDTLR